MTNQIYDIEEWKDKMALVQTEMVLATPEMAKEWVKKNTQSNREFRPKREIAYREAYKRGEWRIHHQGVAFNVGGEMIDGQHRAAFISKLPSGSLVPIMVTTGLPMDAYEAIDLGAHRSIADIYGIDQDLAAVARVFARYATSTRDARSGLTPQAVMPYVEWVVPEYESLLAFCPAKRRLWSSAPIRAAAVYWMKHPQQNADLVRMDYHSIIYDDVASMSAATLDLVRQLRDNTFINARTSDALFAMSLRAFDSTQRDKDVRNLVPVDTETTRRRVREFVVEDMAQKAQAKKGAEDAPQAEGDSGAALDSARRSHTKRLKVA